MSKTILITGSTDGIGKKTALKLAEQGHRLLLHGRSRDKLDAIASEVGGAKTYLADLADLRAVIRLGEEIRAAHDHLDVLINNAGVFKTPETRTIDGLDVRFAVNTIAPYLLTGLLLSLLGSDGRVVNLSSAAQLPVDLEALTGLRGGLADMEAYAQSKASITAWTLAMADRLGDVGPTIVAVNPGSLLASKMVKEGFGVAGNDLSIGADILVRAALSDDFGDATGRYYDNDARRFAEPDRFVAQKAGEIVSAIEATLDRVIGTRN